jgi:hypothetical protein
MPAKRSSSGSALLFDRKCRLEKKEENLPRHHKQTHNENYAGNVRFSALVSRLDGGPYGPKRKLADDPCNSERWNDEAS